MTVRQKQVMTKRKTDPVLAGYTEKVNTLGRKMLTDVLEIGRILILAKKRAGHGHWLPWLETVALNDDTARNFMRVSRLLRSPRFRKFRNMKAPLTVLYQLTKGNVSDATREVILGHIASGEKVSPSTIKVHSETVQRAIPMPRAVTPAEPLLPRVYTPAPQPERLVEVTAPRDAYRDLVEAWARANPEQRDHFLKHIGAMFKH